MIKKYRIGGFCGVAHNYVDERHIKEIADAGINFIFVESGFTPEQQRTIGEYCDKYGIDFLITDDRLYGPAGEYTKCDIITQNYRGYKNFVGNFISDEPNAERFDELARSVSEYTSVMPDKLAVVNLLPMYGPEGCLKADSYEEYVERYINKVNTPFVAVDVYPCGWNEGRKVTYENYCKNLSIVSAAARRSGREFWGFLQSTSWLPGVRIPDETDLRWQAYTHLAFGASTIIYFTYIMPNPNQTETFKYGFTDKNGEKTSTYYYGKAVNREVKKLTDVLCGYDYDGSFYYECTDDTPYLKFDECCEIPDYIDEFICDKPLLAGCFSACDANAVMAVNMSDLQLEERAKITVSFKRDVTITTHASQSSVCFSLKAGQKAEFTVECGGGLLITAQ